MDLKVGDRLVDETGEWEIIGRPYTTAGGKNARVRVQRVASLPSPSYGPGAPRARQREASDRRGGQAMTCERSALVLSALGVLGIGAVLTFDG